MQKNSNSEYVTLPLLRQIFDHSDAVVAVVDYEKLRVIYANKAAIRFYGYSEEDFNHILVTDILLVSPSEYNNYIKKVRNSESTKVKFRHRKKNGEIVTVLAQTSPINIENQSCILSIIMDVSASERVETELQQQKEWLNSVLQATQSGIVIIDRESHTIVDMNRAAYKIIGGSLDSIIGKKCHNFICPNAEGNCPISDFNRTILNEERIVLNKEGKRIPIIKSVIEKEISGRKYLIESFIDISDRKKLEELILAERNFFDALVNSIPIPIFYKGTDGKYLGCNKAYEEFEGYSSDELKGKSAHDILPSTMAKAFEEDDKRIISREIALVSKETKMTTAKGEIREVYFTKAPFFAQDGTVMGVIGSFFDITHRKQIENELVEQREFQKALLNSLPNPIFFMGRDGRYMGCNPAFEKYKNLTEEELIGKSVFDLEPPELARLLRDKDQRIFDGIDSTQVFESAVTSNGRKTQHILIHKSPFHSVSGNVLGLIGSFIDITDRKEQEEEKQLLIEQLIHSKDIIEDSLYQKNALLDELTSAHDELRHANAEKDRVLSIITHDLKDPFVALLNNSEMLETYFARMENDQKLKLISGIKTAANYSYSLLDNLLIWARKQINDIDIRKDFVNVFDMINNTIFVMNQAIEDKKIEISTVCQNDTHAYCDKNLLSYVLKSVIANAIKYSFVGGMVSIKTRTNGKFVELSVEDKGVGISEESLAKMFSFTEGVRTPGTANEMGTGLSLIITKAFVEMNSGAIFIQSTPNYGTNVVFTMPVDNNTI